MSIALSSLARLDPVAASGPPPSEEMLAGSRLQTIFLASQCAMVTLASVIFAASEGGLIPVVSGVMAPFALYAVDRQRWLRLPNYWAGFLGLVAMFAAFIEFISGNIEVRLLSGGHFMCYLTWIVLWQTKEWRQHWMLAALSVLQVAIATLLTNSPWLGVGLFAYISVSLWTLCVFTMYRMETISAESQARRLRPLKFDVWFPVDLLPAARPARTSELRVGMSGRFIGISLAVIFASLAFSIAAFVLVPRVWVGQFQIFDNSPLPGTRPMTGFTQEVRLGDLGEVLESSEPVMEVEFYDDATGRKLTLENAYSELGDSQPLFRGAVLEKYVNGRWIYDGQGLRQRSYRELTRDFLRQEIKLYPLGTDAVFIAGDPRACVALEPIENILVHPINRTFFRDPTADLRSSLRYFALSHPDGAVSAQAPPARWVGVPPQTLTVPLELQQLATTVHDRLRQQEGLQTERERALFLESWLRDSGEFSYSLNMTIVDPSVDPIHDFFFNRKAGHCEYYASALVMMLRAAGIHARMVTGFKGGTEDAARNTLTVRQLHAHAWVEAWIDEQWLQLDGTPMTRLESVQSIQSGGGWSRWYSRMQSVWNDGLTWSKDDQDELIFNPMRRAVSTTWNTLKSPAEGVQRMARSARRFLSDPSQWFSWQGGLVVVIFLLLLVAVWKFIRFLIAAISRQRQLAAQREAGGSTVAFYARFESLLGRLGLTRGSAETPREFAIQVHNRFQMMPEREMPPGLPSRVADSFYSVRFGGNDLDAQSVAEIESGLDQLEEQIRRGNGYVDEQPTGRNGSS